MVRNVGRHIVIDVIAANVFFRLIDVARLWAARRSLRVGPVDPLLAARVFAEWDL